MQPSAIPYYVALSVYSCYKVKKKTYHGNSVLSGDSKVYAGMQPFPTFVVMDSYLDNSYGASTMIPGEYTESVGSSVPSCNHDERSG